MLNTFGTKACVIRTAADCGSVSFQIPETRNVTAKPTAQIHASQNFHRGSSCIRCVSTFRPVATSLMMPSFLSIS
jgi:hypothetical protein